jgi:hypothetical protein
MQLCKKRYSNFRAAETVAIAADMRPSAAHVRLQLQLVVVAAQCEFIEARFKPNRRQVAKLLNHH